MWGWAQWRASSPPQPPSPPFVTNEPRAVSVRLLRKVAYFKRMTKAAEEKASMLEPTDEMWGKASARPWSGALRVGRGRGAWLRSLLRRRRTSWRAPDSEPRRNTAS